MIRFSNGVIAASACRRRRGVKATPARVNREAIIALGSSRAAIEHDADVAAQRRIARRAVERGEPFLAGQLAVAAIGLDEAAHELDERAARGGLGDHGEDGAAGIISAMLVAIERAGDAAPAALSVTQSSIAR